MAQFLARVLDQFLGWLSVFLPNLLKGALIALAGWYVAGKAKQLLLRTGERLKWERTLAEYMGNTLRYAIVAVFAISALKKAGFPVNSLLAAVGISGVIIGLGSRRGRASARCSTRRWVCRPACW